jgi:hypothetical protein
MTDKRVEIAALDITAMRASLATFTGYAAVEVESYRQDVGALLDALEATNAEAATMRAWAEEAAAAENANAEDARKERAAVVAWLRGEPERLVECNGHRHTDGTPCWVMSPMPAEELADAIERGEHRREETE